MKRKQLAKIDLSNPDRPKVEFANLKAFQGDLLDFNDEAKVYITIETYYRKRTLNQNNYFHLICSMIGDETGQDLESVKSTIKLLYARKPVLDKNGEQLWNIETGEPLEYVQDTRDMTTVEMVDLCEKARMFALDYFGIVVPLPNEQVELKLNQ